MKYRVTIGRREGLADPEGVTTARGLKDLGYDDVTSVHFGRIIDVEIAGDDVAAGQSRVEEMCERMLANPVIEDYTVERVG